MAANVPWGSTAVASTIDLSAPASVATCGPCHPNLSGVDVPGLIFSHGNHLLVGCDGCHLRPPHRDGETDRIAMQVCFACHGVTHGPQGTLAKGECSDCHTPSHQLRPASHTKTWAEKPHAKAAVRDGTNGCMMCHDAPKDCDECHREKAPDVGAIPNVYHSVVNPLPSGPPVEIYPSGPVSMSQCAYCHPDLDAIPKDRLIFEHGPHLGRNYRCESCHPVFAHNMSGTEIPTMNSCYRCHDAYHNGRGQIAEGQDCGKCHPKSFELLPPDHTNKFVTGAHKKAYDADPQSCSMCHESEPCVECHSGEGTSPNAPNKDLPGRV